VKLRTEQSDFLDRFVNRDVIPIGNQRFQRKGTVGVTMSAWTGRIGAGTRMMTGPDGGSKAVETVRNPGEEVAPWTPGKYPHGV